MRKRELEEVAVKLRLVLQATLEDKEAGRLHGKNIEFLIDTLEELDNKLTGVLASRRLKREVLP